jgi:outer membrane lipoprotein-sorting protein
MNKNIRIVLVIFILVLTPVSWQSCSGALTPEDIIARARWAMNEVGSYHMANYYSASENSTGGLGESYVEVDFLVPDRYQIMLEGGEFATGPIIVIGDEYYLYTSDSGLSATAYALEQSVNRESIFSFLGFLKDFKELADEDIDGSVCYHLTASWDREKQLEYYGDSLQQQLKNDGLPELSKEELAERIQYLSDLLVDVNFESEIWIDKDSLFIKKIVLTQKQTSQTESGIIEYVTNASINISMINAPITIEPPLDENGLLQAGWLQTTYEE